MIVDINAYVGHWPSHPVDGGLEAVRGSLARYGIDRICVSPLDGAWCRNPHLFNGDLYEACAAVDDVWPVPVIDPTVSTWPRELERAAGRKDVRMVKLLPAYSGYRLEDAENLLREAGGAGLCVVVQTRLEDPRRQHPLAQVPDVPAASVADAAERHPGVSVVIGGPRTGEIRQLKGRILEAPNLYADVSQADGLDGVKLLVDLGLLPKLLFGSHAPLFTPYAALSRVVTDLSDDEGKAILGGNAARLLGL